LDVLGGVVDFLLKSLIDNFLEVLRRRLTIAVEVEGANHAIMLPNVESCPMRAQIGVAMFVFLVAQVDNIGFVRLEIGRLYLILKEDPLEGNSHLGSELEHLEIIKHII
jgi:hypothetical protein